MKLYRVEATRTEIYYVLADLDTAAERNPAAKIDELGLVFGDWQADAYEVDDLAEIDDAGWRGSEPFLEGVEFSGTITDFFDPANLAETESEEDRAARVRAELEAAGQLRIIAE